MYLKFLSVLIAVLAINSNLFADKVEDIIQNSIKNAGGTEKFENIKTITFSADMNIAAQGVDLKLNFSLVKPNMMKLVTIVPSMGMELEAGTDGTDFWGTAPGSKDRVKIPEENLMQIQAQLNGFKGLLDPPMLDFKNRGLKSEYKGTEDIDEKKCEVIIFTQEDGSKSEMFFDAISNLIYLNKSVVSSEGQEFVIEMKVKEYQRVDGMTLPKRIEVYQNGQMQQKITISEVKFNTQLNPDDFKLKK